MSREMNRRAALRMIGGAPLAMASGRFAHAAAADSVKCINLGFVLGIHCPPTYGLLDECPNLGLHVEMQRFQRMRDVLQTITGGTGDIGVAEPILLYAGRQAGNDVVMIGNFYLHTTLVVVANNDVLSDREVAGEFAAHAREHRRNRATLEASDLDWTILAAPWVTDDQPLGAYDVVVGDRAGARRIATADLALAVVDALDRAEWIGHVVGVSAPVP